jgi:LacI family transcriptional regulator
VLNGRNPVKRAKAEAILQTAQAIGFRAAGAIGQRLSEDRPERRLGFLLQDDRGAFYRLLGESLKAEVETAATIRGRCQIDIVTDLIPASVADHITRLARQNDAVAVVAADHPLVSQAIDHAAGRGVPVFALISDLTAASRAGYVGLDNWKVGRTAAWAVANLCRQPGKIGLLLGSHRYLCQDVCEISFRSYFREHLAGFEVMESRTTFENPDYAYENTLDLLKRNPDLRALFVAGGGIAGVLRALADRGAAEQIVTIALDLTEETRAALIDGTLKLVLSHPRALMARSLVQAMLQAMQMGGPPLQTLLPFDLWTAENV